MSGVETAISILYPVAYAGCFVLDYFRQLKWQSETVILIPRKGGKTDLAQRLANTGAKRKIVDLDELMKLRADAEGKGNLLRADNHPDTVIGAMGRFEMLEDNIKYIRNSFKLGQAVYLSSDVYSVQTMFKPYQIVACYQSKRLFDAQMVGMGDADRRIAEESRQSIQKEFPREDGSPYGSWAYDSLEELCNKVINTYGFDHKT